MMSREVEYRCHIPIGAFGGEASVSEPEDKKVD